MTKVYKKYLDSSGKVYRAIEPSDIDDLEIIGINADPGMRNVKFPYKGQEVQNNLIYQGSSIDLSDVEKGAAANPDTFNRMYVKDGENKLNKVFFVNEVKLLKRFQEKLSVPEGTFTYFMYEGDTNKEKNSVITWSEERDWSLDLPDCYVKSEINPENNTELLIKFGEYIQIEKSNGFNYLLDNLINNRNIILDVSINTISNEFNNIKIILDQLIIITTGIQIDLSYVDLFIIKYNINGFISTTQLNLYVSYSNYKIINKCYAIYISSYDDRINIDNKILIKPKKSMFTIDNDKYGIVRCGAYTRGHYVEIEELHCTNAAQFNTAFPEKFSVNILTYGAIPEWIYKYMKLPIKVKNAVSISGTFFCELVLPEDITVISDFFKIDSINALPAPGIGIYLGDGITEDYTSSIDLSGIDLETGEPLEDN